MYFVYHLRVVPRSLYTIHHACTHVVLVVYTILSCFFTHCIPKHTHSFLPFLLARFSFLVSPVSCVVSLVLFYCVLCLLYILYSVMCTVSLVYCVLCIMCCFSCAVFLTLCLITSLHHNRLQGAGRIAAERDPQAHRRRFATHPHPATTGR